MNWVLVPAPCGSPASRPLKMVVVAMASAGTFVADAAPGLGHDILIIDDEPALILRGRRLAIRVSPRTAAGPIRSCAGHRCVGP